MKHYHNQHGFITKIWGPSAWKFLHTASFAYPLEPTEDEKREYRSFFNSLQYVLPCSLCRDSYKKFIHGEIDPKLKLTDNVFKNRDTLTRWLYDLHQAVNAKLDIDYGISYEDVVERYEAYRATCVNSNEPGCEDPAKLKEISYTISETIDCPIISTQTAYAFVNYARQRQLPDEEFKFISSCEPGSSINMKCQNWTERNKQCYEIIKEMRKKSIPSLETSGIYEGLPTIHELKLILRLCSTMARHDLNDIVIKLNKPISKKYVLTKN